MEIIRKNKHNKDCAAMQATKEGYWKTPWAYPEITYANKRGNKTPARRGYIGWVKIICNDTQCPTELWIKNDDFLETLPKE